VPGQPDAELGALAPAVSAPLPGAIASRLVETLAATECPALTTRRARRRERSGAPHDPIVWARARGANVVDADGNIFVDLTAGFGVAAVGHAHPRVVEAVQRQAGTLLHALGDVHPSDVKVRLLERLASMAPWPSARVILGLNGGDAVEAALKTAMLATRRPGVLAFEGGYHGLAYGPLAACGYSAAFREPFAEQLNPHVTFAPFPAASESVERALERVAERWDAAESPIGAALVEPVQGRGGVNVPPAGFLAGLGALARDRGALLVSDEILVGLGRCGARWASVEDGAAPDLICAGKALGGGLPVSACLGRAEVMAAWGDPDGEALHTVTFLGHPLGCAAALATLDILEGESLAARAIERGSALCSMLRDLAARRGAIVDVRGRGMLVGIELDRGERTLAIVRRLLEAGYITLPAGSSARVLELTPPLAIAPQLLERFIDALDDALGAVA